MDRSRPRQREEGARAHRPPASIARGEALFNDTPINIAGVAGLNDVLGQPSISGLCGTCHDTPNVGNRAVKAPLDIGKLKGPILRGLASRAPFFHNGSAATLSDVVDFYDQRFGIGFTRQRKADLVAFLASL
jgi:cytochrome c peroxidase